MPPEIPQRLARTIHLLTVPQSQRCSPCDGTGWIEAAFVVSRCPVCDGRGRRG